MPAIEPLCRLIGIYPGNLTSMENILLEIDFFICIHEEWKEVLRQQYKDYFQLMKLTIEKENKMIESKFIRSIIQDILSTNEYSLEGIALYTNTPQDVLLEIYSEQNLNPSATLLRKIIELHRTVRHDLYLQIAKKIASKYLAIA